LNVIKFIVGKVQFTIDCPDSSNLISLPTIYQRFDIATAGIKTPADCDLIRFQISLVQTLPAFPVVTKLTSEPSWQVGLDQAGNYLFSFNSPLPARSLIMDPDFSSGKLYLQETKPAEGRFPLNTLDIIVYSNWLANRGDLLLHASGMTINGKGYAFVGRSGAGKSTLVAKLAEDCRITVLGEDQVALRYLNGAYWIFGTPWHLNMDMCSPIGVPLQGIFFLDREAADILTPLQPHQGFTRLMQTSFIPYYRPPQVSLIMDNLERLSREIPFSLLAYRLGDDIIKTVLDATNLLAKPN